MVKTRAQHRKQMMWDRVESAQGVFIDILSRVPVKSIRRFKTVNKYWHRSISNKYFVTQQIMQSRKNTTFIACPIMKSSMKLYCLEVGSLKVSYLNTIYPSEISYAKSMYMISSFNGLICCVNQISDEDIESEFWDLQIWICNPCTGESLLLPQGRPSFQFEPIVGVAYGSDISDYRVFRISCAGKKLPQERASVDSRDPYELAYECEVYSSISGSWKYIGLVPCVPKNYNLRPYNSSHVFVGGKIYWLVSVEKPGKILSVDLEGRFEVINLPDEYGDHLRAEDKITEASHLLILQGCLALFVMHDDYMDIWIWKAKGEKYSWECEYCDEVPFDVVEMVLTVTSIKNKILILTDTHWCTYDVDTKTWNMERGPRNRYRNPAVFPFNESLLPCNGGVRL